MANPGKKTKQDKNDNASFVLLLDFSKFEDFYVQEFAFDVLGTKGKKKSKFVCDCLKYYEAHGGITVTQQEEKAKRSELSNCAFSQNTDATLAFLRYLKRIAERYDLNSILKIIDFFKMDMNSERFQQIKDNTLPHYYRSRKMSLGFYKRDKESATCFHKLINLSMNERIALVSNAIQMYTQDMQDEIIAKCIENQVVVELITRCQSGTKEENEARITEFTDLINAAKSLNITNSANPLVYVGEDESISAELGMFINNK